MRIKMLQSANGSDLGANGASLPVKEYTKDSHYEVGDSLARTFVTMKKAEVVGKKQLSAAPENKAASAQPDKPIPKAESIEDKEAGAADVEVTEDGVDLDKMKIDQLRSLAGEQKVDIKGLKKKTEIVAKLSQELGA